MKGYVFFVMLWLFVGSYLLIAQDKNKTDAKGLKQGYWEKLDPATKKVLYKGSFKNDKPQGVFYYYHKGTDTLRSKMDFREDGKIAYATLYGINGKIEANGKYVNELKDSVWNFYDGKGVLLSTESYSNGKKNGPSKLFDEKGNIIEEKHYKNGLEDGPFTSYYNDKTIKAEGAYLNGEFNGKCVWYYPDKTIAAQGFYDKGIKKGVWVYNLADGKKPEREVWQNGKKLSDKEAEEFFKKKKEEKK
jgi:antitoxin component YwqK of YwqJK toxin-antitoxin module